MAEWKVLRITTSTDLDLPRALSAAVLSAPREEEPEVPVDRLPAGATAALDDDADELDCRAPVPCFGALDVDNAAPSMGEACGEVRTDEEVTVLPCALGALAVRLSIPELESVQLNLLGVEGVGKPSGPSASRAVAI